LPKGLQVLLFDYFLQTHSLVDFGQSSDGRINMHIIILPVLQVLKVIVYFCFYSFFLLQKKPLHRQGLSVYHLILQFKPKAAPARFRTSSSAFC